MNYNTAAQVIETLTKINSNKSLLIEKLEEYIAFLGINIDSHIVYLLTHGIVISKEEIEKGNQLRKEIEDLKSQL